MTMQLTEKQKLEINRFYEWGLPRTRGSKIIKSHNWFQVMSPDYKSPSFNEVIHSSISESSFEEKVEEVISQYRDLGTDFKWCIDPFSAPNNARETLINYGFETWKAKTVIKSVKARQKTMKN